MKLKRRVVGKALLGVMAGALILSVLLFIVEPRPSPPKTTQTPSYPLLEKTLGYGNGDKIINFQPLRTQVGNYLKVNANSEYSFYFEYLPTGTSIRHENDEDGLIGASLLKLPIVMDLYKAQENDLVNLDETIELKAEWLDDDFGQLYKKGAGTKLTLREAAKETLHNSDNTALNAIYATTGKLIAPEKSAILEVDAPFKVGQDQTVQISAKSYTSILKCLYYACYNSPANSQEILQYLVEAPASNRLGAVIPSSVPVAHKIGSFSTATQSDCGIVYVPNRHYSICVMLNLPPEKAEPIIRDLSALVYNYVINK